MASDITVHELGEPEFGAWTALVSASPDGSVYSLPRYLEVLCAAAGGGFRVLGVRHGDELVGGVALYERPSRLGPYVSTRRLLYYNGIVLKRYDTKYPSEQTGRHLKATAALAEAVASRGYASVQLSCRGSLLDVRPFLAAGWSAAPQYTYVVPVGDLELLWSRVEQNLRRLIRRAEKEGAAVVSDDDFTAFFRLHAGTMGRRGQELYLPEEAFRRWFEALRAADLCRLFHARLPGGRAVASQVVLLGPRPVSHSVAAATDPEFMKSGVSALLRWKVFEAVRQLGFAENDLTDASLNPVTHFKSQLGGELQLFFSLEAPRSAGRRLASWAVARARGAASALRGGGR